MKKLRNSARGQECTARVPGICNGDPSTTVLCHIRLPWNAGAGMKPPDYMGFFACSACHDALDGRTHDLDVTYRRSCMLSAHLLTLEWWFENGYLSET